MKPFFSIVVPTYNRAHLIAKAIDSVMAQTYAEWELLIVDDGSKDNTREVVTAYTDPRVKYIYQQNAERSAARNNGIKQALGTYICFLDSDDYYLPNRLQLLYQELEKRNFPVAAFYTGLVFDVDGALSNFEQPLAETATLDYIATSTIHSQQACIHATILKQFNYDTAFHIGEDMELWLRIVDKYPFYYFDNQFTVVVLEHDNRSVNIRKYNTYPDRLRMLKRVFSDSHPGKNISAKIKRELISTSYFGIAKYFIYTGKRWQAVFYLLRAIFTDMGSIQNKYRLNLIIHLVIRRVSDQKMEELLGTQVS